MGALGRAVQPGGGAAESSLPREVQCCGGSRSAASSAPLLLCSDQMNCELLKHGFGSIVIQPYFSRAGRGAARRWAFPGGQGTPRALPGAARLPRAEVGGDCESRDSNCVSHMTSPALIGRLALRPRAGC